MSPVRVQRGRWLSLLLVLAGVAVPASPALAVSPALRDAIHASAEAELATLDALEKACEDCIDPDADEAIVDQGAAPVEMRAATEDETRVMVDEADVDADDTAAVEPEDRAPHPLDPIPLPLQSPLSRTRAALPLVLVASGTVVMGPVWGPAYAHAPKLPALLDSEPQAVACAHVVRPSVARAVTWLRQRRSLPSSDDAGTSLR